MDFILGIARVLWLVIPIAFLVLGIAMTVISRNKGKWCRLFVTSVLALLAAFVMYYSALVSAFSVSYNEDISVKLPDSDVQLVIKEWRTLKTSGAYIYVKEPIGKTLIGSTWGGDDGYCYFENGGYEIVNNGDGTFTIILRDSTNSEEHRETFSIE